jgi:hypothetical protein
VNVGTVQAFSAFLTRFPGRAHVAEARQAAPFVATLMDVCGLVIYFSIADVILKGTLL